MTHTHTRSSVKASFFFFFQGWKSRQLQLKKIRSEIMNNFLKVVYISCQGVWMANHLIKETIKVTRGHCSRYKPREKTKDLSFDEGKCWNLWGVIKSPQSLFPSASSSRVHQVVRWTFRKQTFFYTVCYISS